MVRKNSSLYRIITLVSLVSLVLATGLACRAVSELPNLDQQTEPTSTPLPSATIAPLPSPTTVPTLAPEAEASPTPGSDEGELESDMEELSGTLEAEMTEASDMGVIPLGTPYLESSYRGVPIYPNAQNVTEANEALTFFTDDSISDVWAFYKDAMPAEDWTFIGGDTESESAVVALYNKGEQFATIAITPDFLGGKTMVIMSVQ
jgi:hypothetical protein